MDQNDFEMRYVVLTQDILENKELGAIEKIILARITGFERFFEAPSTTAEILGISELVVQRAKRKLLALGYIEQIGDTGRGKIYRANLWKSQSRCDEKVISDMTKKSHQILPKSHTENKERIKREYKRECEKCDDVEKSEFGRADINELVTLWEKETGISIQGEQLQRRQLYNLTRKYGCERVKVLVRLVGDAIRSRDRFAPQIAKPSDLVGKYGKLEKLKMWNDRRKPQFTPAPPMAMASLKKQAPYKIDDISDEEHERVSEMFKEARQKLLK